MSLALWENPALTATECDRLAACERVIERGLATFVEVGNALLEIRDGRLYRARFGNFDDYCHEQWGFTRMRASYLIAAAEVVRNVNRGLHSPPANERQARPLSALPPEQQPEAWQKAVETAPNGKITAAHVQSVVREALAEKKQDRKDGRAALNTLAEELGVGPDDEEREAKRVRVVYAWFDAMGAIAALPPPESVIGLLQPYERHRMSLVPQVADWVAAMAAAWKGEHGGSE